MSIYYGNNKVKPSGIGKAYFGNNLFYQATQPISEFYIEALQGGQVYWTLNGTNTITGMEYKINDDDWADWEEPYDKPKILDSGDKLYLRSTMNSLYQNQITTNFNFNIGGNINTLINNVDEMTSINDNCFNELFHRNANLKSINDLVLPSKVLAYQCYGLMFRNCTGLTSIPDNLLTATTLAPYCYNSMFEGCTGIRVGQNTGTGNLVLDLSSFSSLPTYATGSMFYRTSGTFNSTPTIPNKYYLEN